jgi:hypothetical protein
VILSEPRGVALYSALLAEACAVACAHGVGRPGFFDAEWQEKGCAEMSRLPAGASASLSRDVIAVSDPPSGILNPSLRYHSVCRTPC